MKDSSVAQHPEQCAVTGALHNGRDQRRCSPDPLAAHAVASDALAVVQLRPRSLFFPDRIPSHPPRFRSLLNERGAPSSARQQNRKSNPPKRSHFSHRFTPRRAWLTS